ncbi:topoisomerase C-terminal repeat-containing protein, partial [Akkermansia muciniphila]|uniref:topoisomerase C-terminal repeat-containing protein n=1 Tax=Akkermansia muciniphila TaxID=239935 RepID=UPI002108B956
GDCRSCNRSSRKFISGRDMTDEELKTLIVDGRTGILHGFTSRFCKPFEAGLELNDKFRSTLYFPAREEDEAAG